MKTLIIVALLAVVVTFLSIILSLTTFNTCQLIGEIQRTVVYFFVLLLLKFELAGNKTPFIAMILTLASNIATIFFHDTEELYFFRIFSTQLLLYTHASLYLTRDHRAYPVIVSSLCVTVFAFYISLGKTVTITFTIGHHFKYLFSAIIHHLFSALIFHLSEAEVNLYTQLLKQFIHVSDKKSDEKTNFISRMSHDLRTPLHGLLSLVYLLKKTTLNEEQHSYLTVMDSCGSLLLDTVMKILDLSKIESGKVDIIMKDFSLFQLIQEIFDSLSVLADSKNNQFLIYFKLDPDGYDIEGDRTHLKDILFNVNLFFFTFSFLLSFSFSLSLLSFFFLFFFSFFFFPLNY